MMSVPIPAANSIAAHAPVENSGRECSGPSRTEHNVIGERVWPAFAMKSIGLGLCVGGVLAAMGALFDVNPIWLYGPFEPGAATSFAQPDWYIGFLEGSVRLMPPWETRIGRYTINNLVYSAMVIPGLIFTTLFLVPWIERRLTGDTAEHHLLDRPRDAPGRTGAGAASIAAVAVLFLGGSQDVIADTFNVAIGTVTTTLQIAFLVAPPVTFVVTRHLCRSLSVRPDPERTEREIDIVRSAAGGYVDPEHSNHGEIPPRPRPSDGSS